MQESAASSWEIIERGVFAVARCHVCGWHSPARRAYSTARRDGLEHGGTCPGSVSASGPVAEPEAPSTTSDPG